MDTDNLATDVKPRFGYSISQSPWDRPSKIVVGLDIGTTYSGVAFAYLERGFEPMLHRVTHWPGQQNPQDKVASLIWYNLDSQPTSFGVEAQTSEIEAKAEDYGWRLARYFKSHLYPHNLQDRYGLVLEPLPLGVSLHRIYSDFLHYLLQQTRRAFEAYIPDGEKLWRDHHQDMVVVIGLPKGHGIQEKKFFRSAVVAAGFVTSDKASRHIRFVTEAEASMHFSLQHTNLRNSLHAGMNIVLCDAGGSTVDTTLYAVRDTSPRLQLEEVRESTCVQAGAVFVDKQAESYLHQLLEIADLPPDEISEYVVAGTKDFEAQAKRAFHEATETCRIRIGNSGPHLPSLRIRRGLLTLTGSTIQLFFDRCISDIIHSINSQVSSVSVPYIFLSGGFGDNPYLRKQLRAWFEPMRTQVATTNETSTRAVADGTIMWYCANGVNRTHRCTYGVEVDVPFDQGNAEHCERAAFVGFNETCAIKGAWFPLVLKGSVIDDEDIVRRTYTFTYQSSDLDLGSLDLQVYGYTLGDTPGWLKDKSGHIFPGFESVYSITVDLNHMRKALQPRLNDRGVLYWALMFNVCFQFGDMDLIVFLEWVEEGMIRAGPRIVIPGPEEDY